MLQHGFNLISKCSFPLNTLSSPKLINLIRVLKATKINFSTVITTSNPLTLDFIKQESEKKNILLYIHDKNDTYKESELKKIYSNIKYDNIIVANIKNVNEDVISHFEVSNLPFSNYIAISNEKNSLGPAENLKSLIENPNSDLEKLAFELSQFIDIYHNKFSIDSKMVQIAASAAVLLSDMPAYTLGEMYQFLKNKNFIPMNGELSILVDSLLYKDKFKEQLANLNKIEEKYSESGLASRVHRAISARYFKEKDNKMALEHAYTSLKIDIEEQQSKFTEENFLQLDTRKIDVFSNSCATIFIKHLITAIGESDDILDIRAKIEFMFRDTKFVPLKFKPKSRAYGGPPKKGRGYRAKWIWHGLDHRPGKYKPKDIYKYHDEWRSVHDKSILDY